MTITNSTCSVEGWTLSKFYIFYGPSHYFRFPLSLQLSHMIITLFGGMLCCCLCFLWIGRHLSFYLDLQENLFQVLINWQVCCLSLFHFFDCNSRSREYHCSTTKASIDPQWSIRQITEGTCEDKDWIELYIWKYKKFTNNGSLLCRYFH